MIFAADARGEWKIIAEGDARAPAMWYDSARTAYELPYLTTWTRVVLRAPATLANGVEYLSAVQKIAFDCASRSWVVVHSEFFANADASGSPVYSYALPREQWHLRPARSDSNAARLLRVVCVIPRPW